jgi:hypothetical protein
MGLVGASMRGRSAPFSDTTPNPVDIPALEGFPNRFLEAGRDVREAGRLGRGPDGGSVKGPEGRLGWNDRGSSSRAERCSIFKVGAGMRFGDSSRFIGRSLALEDVKMVATVGAGSVKR